MTSPTAYGRGAWTTKGKDNSSRLYEYIVGKPMDGGTPTKSLDHKAVNSAVKAIQRGISGYAYPQILEADGVLGPKTATAIKWFQQKKGLTIDGRVGTKVATSLFNVLIMSFANKHKVPVRLLYGQTFHESSFDPGARGYFNPPDSGLVQINLQAHPEITWEQAFDPRFALEYSAKRMKAALDKYASKPNLQIVAAIAQHNSPASANTWYNTGVAPNNSILQYVESVLRYADLWTPV